MPTEDFQGSEQEGKLRQTGFCERIQFLDQLLSKSSCKTVIFETGFQAPPSSNLNCQILDPNWIFQILSIYKKHNLGPKSDNLDYSRGVLETPFRKLLFCKKIWTRADPKIGFSHKTQSDVTSPARILENLQLAQSTWTLVCSVLRPGTCHKITVGCPKTK